MEDVVNALKRWTEQNLSKHKWVKGGFEVVDGVSIQYVIRSTPEVAQSVTDLLSRSLNCLRVRSFGGCWSSAITRTRVLKLNFKDWEQYFHVLPYDILRLLLFECELHIALSVHGHTMPNSRIPENRVCFLPL